jgi:YHS domain-containing protein
MPMPGTMSGGDDFLELADEDDDDDEDLDDKSLMDDQPLKLPDLDTPAAPAPLPAAAQPRSAAPPVTMNKPAEKPIERAREPETAPPSRPAERPIEKPAEKGPPSAPESLKGLKGFCPVILKDERRLVEARGQYNTQYRGKTYTFSSQEARNTFEANPAKYVPVEGGRDVVRLAGGNQNELDGTLEHAAWYRGRLYLFTSEESRREFVETPKKFMRDE